MKYLFYFLDNLILISPDFRIGRSENVGNANESFYINVDLEGTWYIGVYQTDGKFSADSNYSLFAGNAWTTRSTDSIPTNMRFDFNSGNFNTMAEWQILDLRSYPGILDSAKVKTVELQHGEIHGNPGCLVKYLTLEQDPNKVWKTFYSGGPVLDFPEDKYLVKQRWGISCSVETLIGSDKYATIMPNIKFTYKCLVD